LPYGAVIAYTELGLNRQTSERVTSRKALGKRADMSLAFHGPLAIELGRAKTVTLRFLRRCLYKNFPKDSSGLMQDWVKT
jgi:hypothetical protein